MFLGGSRDGERFDAYDAVLFSNKKRGNDGLMWMDDGMLFMKTFNKSEFSREEPKKKVEENLKHCIFKLFASSSSSKQ